MMTNLIIPYRPNHKQKLFHEANAKIRWYFGGIGAGKTAGLVNEHIKMAINNPKTLSVILAPTYKMLENVDWREFFKFCPGELVRKFNKADLSVTLINGSEILFLAGDTDKHIDRLRGLTIGFASVDEVQQFSDYILTVLLGRLRQKDAPLKLMLFGSPKGFDWIHNRLVADKEKHKDTDDWIHATTYDNRENVGDEYIKTMESQFTGIFKQQELLGEFVGFEGLVYPQFSRSIHLFEGGQFKFKEVICGVDWGWTHPSAMVIAGLDFDNRIWVIDEFYEKGVIIDELIKKAKELKEKYNIAYFIADPSKPDFIQMFRTAGLNTREANNAVMEGIVLVSSYLEVQSDGKPRLFVKTTCRNLQMEFANYRYADKKITEKDYKEEPLKIYDDLLDALRYLIMSMPRHKEVIRMAGAKR